MTSLPMVFALWAGPTQFVMDDHRAAFAGSCRFGLEHLDEIIAVSQKERASGSRHSDVFDTPHCVRTRAGGSAGLGQVLVILRGTGIILSWCGYILRRTTVVGVIKRYTDWLHTRWPAGTVEKDCVP